MDDATSPPDPPAPPPVPAASAASAAEPVTRAEFEEAVRFLHVMSMQTKLVIERIDATLGALTGALLEARAVDQGAMDARLPDAHRQARDRNLEAAHVKVGPADNKYGVPSPAIDCASLIPLCHARCCRLSVHLSFQDIDDGLRWEYARPYELRRREADGYCVYSHPEARGCSVYRQRPAVCRSYDCRTDPRVWLDFEQKIPAPMDRSDPPLFAIRRSKDAR